MRLTDEEKAMLAGGRGEASRRAMEIVVALGEIFGAEDLIPIKSAQIAGVSYKNLGDAGLEFLQEWAGQGARVQVPTGLNPAGMDRHNWKRLGIPEAFAAKQTAVLDAFSAMNVRMTCSCTPYLVGLLPQRGDHLAWAESSAVIFANSVIGARTNREGGPSALAAAIAGRTARYGFHRDEGRRGTHRVRVLCPLKGQADYAALGFLVGDWVGSGVPYITGPGLKASPAQEELKALGAALSVSGGVAMFHMEGLTPEAEAGRPPDGAPAIAVDTLQPVYDQLNTPDGDQVDFVSIGCPHASLEELRWIAREVAGKMLKTPLWITAGRAVAEEAEREGLKQALETSGATVVADTCPVVAPLRDLGFRAIATNSAKEAFYGAGYLGMTVRFGDLEQCVEAAATGRWPNS